MRANFAKHVPTGIAFALCLFSAPILAGPVAHFSRTSILFGGVVLNTSSSTQPVFITNTGDAPLAITALAVTGAQPTHFLVAGTCTPPVSLGPNQRCRIDVVLKPLALPLSGFSTATLTMQSNSTPPSTDVALSGDVDVQFRVATIVPAPEWLDFDAQSVGTGSPPRTLTLTNAALFMLTIDQYGLVGGEAGDFALTSACTMLGQTVAPAQACTATVTFTPQATGPRSTELVFRTSGTTFGGDWANRYSITGIGGNAGPAQTVTVVEYYNQSLDHYFITHVAAEQANLDAGNTPTRWTRTGSTFKAYLAPQAGSSPVCRYYIPPGKGDSHFFGRGTAECNATGAANPTFVLEAPEFMHLFLPVAGVCPAGTTTIYRVFSNRADANHRYMTDRAIRDQMVGQGWLAEGDGPDLVVMCGAS